MYIKRRKERYIDKEGKERNIEKGEICNINIIQKRERRDIWIKEKKKRYRSREKGERYR